LTASRPPIESNVTSMSWGLITSHAIISCTKHVHNHIPLKSCSVPSCPEFSCPDYKTVSIP
jgi:hypothetical protein